MRSWLIDTGPLVAFLDSEDDAHEVVADRWAGFRGVPLTTSAVITETMYFVAAVPDGARRLSELITAGGFRVYDLCQPPELIEAAALMARYSDTPMDFADATLVLLGEGLDVREVLTLDRRGFSAYRTRNRRAFRLVLDS